MFIRFFVPLDSMVDILQKIGKYYSKFNTGLSQTVICELFKISMVRLGKLKRFKLD
jgi:hypothetical protein